MFGIRTVRQTETTTKRKTLKRIICKFCEYNMTGPQSDRQFQPQNTRKCLTLLTLFIFMTVAYEMLPVLLNAVE
jgi:hypothetical protein